jgi:outer membrane receptor protein involved in Fe transport
LHQPSAQANGSLLPERQESYELGLEMSFLKRRLGFDVSLLQQSKYQPNFSYSIIYFNWIRLFLLNAGTIENKGWKYNLTLLHLKLLISDGFKLKLDTKQKFSC